MSFLLSRQLKDAETLFSTDAAMESNTSSVQFTPDTSVTSGFPLVSVPVLSNTTVVIF
jgi:hypothetical protein